ncbi:Uncharacterized protein QTN25_010529 [Entamoeba marina]
MNVVLYFKLFREVQNFVLISSKCKQAVEQLKINPLIQYGQSEKNSLWCYKILKFFPNIQTLQIKDFSCVVPIEIAEQVSYIRLNSCIQLTQFDDYELTGSHWDYYNPTYSPYFMNEKSEYFLYDLSRKYLFNGTTNSGLYNKTPLQMGDEIHNNINPVIIKKLQQYEIYSNETMKWFFQHFKLFESLQTLSIIVDAEMKSRYNYNKLNNYNCNCNSIIELLKSIHTLHKVQLFTIQLNLSKQLIKLINSNSNILFTIYLYSYNYDNTKQYYKLRRMQHVTLIFCCLNQDILKHHYNVSKNFNKNLSFDCLTIESRQLLKDEDILNLIFDKMSYYPTLRVEVRGINKNDNLNSNQLQLDYKHIIAYEMEFYLNSVNDYSITFPNTLQTLLLFTSINTMLFTIYYPTINLLNTNLQYLQMEHIKSTTILLIYIPPTLESIKLFNCKNIQFISSSNKQKHLLSSNPQFSFSCQNCLVVI